MNRPRLISMRAVVALSALSAACAHTVVQEKIVYVERGTGQQDAPPPAREAVADDLPPPLPGIDAVLDAAHAHLGRTQVRVKGKTFRYDCSGFVRGMFSAAGVDLMSEPGDPDDNGVRLIFHYVDRHGQNHFRKLPQKGDLVYFDNTWDKNGDGLLNDPLTHIGIVEEVAADGTMHILHRANRGIVRDPMNLLRPHDLKDADGKELNTWLRPKGRRDPPATPHLMSELFAGFGTVSKDAAVSLEEMGTPSH